jgi:hypothetical protein
MLVHFFFPAGDALIGPCRTGGWVSRLCERRLGECLQGRFRVRPILVRPLPMYSQISRAFFVY